MKKYLFFVLVCSLTTLFSQVEQELYQRAKITYNHLNDGLVQLEDLGIPIDHGIKKQGQFIVSEFSVSQLEAARNAGFQVEVLIENAKQHFLEQNRNAPPLRNFTCTPLGSNYETPVNFEMGSMGGYFTYQEVLDALDQMKALYPNLITTKANISNFLTEGEPDNSVTPSIGGNGIKWVKISDNPNTSTEGEPQILYSAIHHAREPMSLSQLIFYMWYLLENYETDNEVKGIIDNTELYFVPVVNPDGYLYNEKTDPNGGGFWRKNRKNGHGVDNNRNYDYYIDGNPANGVWGGDGTSGNTGSAVYRGEAPFSEIENQAMKWFVENHNFKMAINNHSFGNLLLYPYGYADDVLTPENELFMGISEALVSQNGFNNILSSELYPAAGNTDDFMYGTVNTHDKIYSMTPEIGPTFWPPSNQIEPISKSMMHLNLTAAQMVNNFAIVEATDPLYVGSETNQTIEFELMRLGVVGSGNFFVKMEPVSNNITFVGGGTSFTSLSPLQVQNGSINYSLAGGTTSGDDIVFDLTVNNGTYITSKRVSKKFGKLTPVFEDNGNSVTDNFSTNGWETTTATFVSPSSAITDSPGIDYANNANETITLNNAIDLSGAFGATLSFFAKWEIEENWDYVQLEISTDNGNSWEPQCGKYTNPGISYGLQPEGQPLYDGTQEDWVLEEIDLSDYLDESILVRFKLLSGESQRRDGFYFDDLKVNIVEETVLEITDATNNQFFIYPNPIKNKLTIETPINEFSIQVYSMQGQLLHTSKNNSNQTQLDFSAYASGMYLVRLDAKTNSQTIKVVKQ